MQRIVTKEIIVSDDKFEYLKFLYQSLNDAYFYIFSHNNSDDYNSKLPQLIFAYREEARTHFNSKQLVPLEKSPLGAETVLYFHRANVENTLLKRHSNSEKLISYYQSLWHVKTGHRGEKIDRALELLIDYSEINATFTTRIYWDKHAKIINQIITEYYSSRGVSYFEHTHRDMGFLLFQICKQIPLSEIEADSHLAAIFQVIQYYTGINIENIKSGSELYCFYENLENYLIKNNIPFKEKDFLADEKKPYEKLTLKLPILSLILIQNDFISLADSKHFLELLLKHQFIESREVMKFILDMSYGQRHFRIEKINRIEAMQQCYEYLSLTEDQQNQFLKMAVNRKLYNVALFLFEMINQVTVLNKKYYDSCHISTYSVFINNLYDLINKPVSTDSILNIIDFDKYEPMKINYNYVYLLLFAKKDSIINWESVDTILFTKFNLTPQNLFNYAIESEIPIEIIRYLLLKHGDAIKIDNKIWKSMFLKWVNAMISLSDTVNIVKHFVAHDPDCFYSIVIHNNQKIIAYAEGLQAIRWPQDLQSKYKEVYKLLVNEFSILLKEQCRTTMFLLQAMQHGEIAQTSLPKDIWILLSSLTFKLEFSTNQFSPETKSRYKQLTLFSLKDAEVKKDENQEQTKLVRKSG